VSRPPRSGRSHFDVSIGAKLPAPATALLDRRHPGVHRGAILASLAGEIYPDAYQEAGPYITLATAVGFLVTFLL
jgi:hypothetical protein